MLKPYPLEHFMPVGRALHRPARFLLLALLTAALLTALPGQSIGGAAPPLPQEELATLPGVPTPSGRSLRIKHVFDKGDAGPSDAIVLGLSRKAETGSDALMAFNPQTRHFYLLKPDRGELHELDMAGRLKATYGLPLAGDGALANVQHLLAPVIMAAPSSDLTDSPGAINLYLTDAASPSGVNTIVELTFEPEGEPLPGIDIDPAILKRTTHTYLFSPPSPDPAGVTYVPDRGSLLVSDSEVNEMPGLFTGDNLYEVSLDGELLGTLSTLSFSDEPTGVAHNPLNGDYFFSDDTGTRGIYHLRPGSDGLYGLSSASVTFSPTGHFGNVDPEGITYDTIQGRLFITDGVNEEVYELSPGPNGLFDGSAPNGDDSLVNHFDVTRYGIEDPAGIAFNPDTNTLYILSSDNFLMAETSMDGTLIRYIDISATGARSPAGLAYAPASTASESQPTAKHLFIVDRKVDNDSNPDENDGELYEITIPLYSSPPQPTTTPTATPTSSSTPAPTPTATATAMTPTSTPVATASPGPTPSAERLYLPLIWGHSE